MNELKNTISAATLTWIEKWTQETWEPIATAIDFSQHVAISSKSSLHVYEERYVIGGKTYRLLWTLSETTAEPLIEVLLKV